MSAKNIYHAAVVAALKADGWAITADPLTLKVGKRDLHIDLGAERPVIGAEKAGEKIAVEIQSFLNPSAVADLQQALGQYTLYRLALAQQQPDRGVPVAFGEAQAAVQKSCQSGVSMTAASSTSGPTCSTRHRAPVSLIRRFTNCFTDPSTNPLPILRPRARRSA